MYVNHLMKKMTKKKNKAFENEDIGLPPSQLLFEMSRNAPPNSIGSALRDISKCFKVDYGPSGLKKEVGKINFHSLVFKEN